MYGPAVLSLTRYFDPFGPLHPYAGLGINYTKILANRDGFISDLKVDDGYGPALQAGVELPLGDSWSFAVDVKKIFVKTSATGTLPALGGSRASAEVRLDPTIVQTGLVKHF
jgi:outer membrane protein